MNFRARLTLWYAGIMFISLTAMGAFSYHEFIMEPREPMMAIRNAREEQAEEQDDFRRIIRIGISCGLPALLLAVTGGWWLMRKSLAPVMALTEAAARVNEDNLREQLPRSGNGDELDRLTEVFNSMLQRLEESFKRIHEFTLDASHELKTPLTVLRSQVETLLREHTLIPAQQEFHAGQLDELLRLTRIVDSLTLLAKAESGLLPLKLAPVRFDEIVNENFADTQLLARDSALQVNFTASEPLVVNGDQHRLRQLLLNLADNAVKYNCPSGRIIVSSQRVGDNAVYSISNTGRGIPAEALPHVFERFYRADPAHSQAIEGSGLGLSIVRWIVSAHHGKIQITSDPSKLTTVKVTLPLAEYSA